MASVAKQTIPRVVIAGSGGDAGKTLISMGLAASWKQRGMKVAVFKKGPDYIDAAWLGYAGGRKARNLDTFIMGSGGVTCSFQRNSRGCDISLVEGNRGLYDGLDIAGTHSTAQLAKQLRAPVVLVQDVTKVTRTAAAHVLGSIHLDPDVKIAAVILNRVSGARHEKVVRESIESICGIPVVGAIPKLAAKNLLPDRHLGLVTPQEHPDVEGLSERLAHLIAKYVDENVLLSIAGSAPDVSCEETHEPPQRAAGPPVRIAYIYDSAFTFYYQDNFDALRLAGAKLIPVTSLKNRALPACDGLYIGGGFPETHAAQIAGNEKFLQSVKEAAAEGLPIYAECAGLILLCRSIRWQNQKYPFVGVFPLDLDVMEKPQGHGYMEVRVDHANPHFKRGDQIRGHEFHYSKIASAGQGINTVYRVERGQGCFAGRDGLVYKNVLASFLHLHAAGTPQWAQNFVALARNCQKGGI